MNDHVGETGAADSQQGHELGDGPDGSTEIQMAEASATSRDRQAFACPNCGHELSMYTEPDAARRAENVAARLADFFGSWFFLLFLAVVITAWLVANLSAGRPLSHLDTFLGVVAGMQGPLILLAQRRGAERDRARDIEIFHIAMNTEEDVHAIRTGIEQRKPGMETSVETSNPAEDA